MTNKKFTLSYLFIFALLQFSFAHLPPKKGNTSGTTTPKQASYRSDCASATAQIDLAINNVRARLKTAGDFWWTGSDAGYIIPVVEPGEPEVSSIFAGALWVGGIDPGGNLKMAAQTYGSTSGNEEYWPGPLTDDGSTDADICANWDRFFTVHKTSVDQFKANWAKALAENRTELNPDEIPDEIKGWPALGNPFFEAIHGFALPTGNVGFNGLGEFWDEGGIAGSYDPQFGDYPILSFRGCDLNAPTIPDQMIFSIINDGGGIHSNSNGDNLLMEIHTTAYAFKAEDEVNDMTFYKYRMVNRGIEDLDSTYVGVWVDLDLGCYIDDYIGCDMDRGMAYVYNSDGLDGNADCSDCNGVATYCTDIPVLGIDFFRGPIDDSGQELAMSSFTYYDGSAYNPNNAMVDPQEAVEFYRYLTGSWRDGTPFTYGGSGYNPTSTEYVNFAFSSPPNEINGWSMCSANLGNGDRRTIQSAGPFTLKPGAINEMVTGLVWVPSMTYPCPDLTRLFDADDKAQMLFDNCFEEYLTKTIEPLAFDPINIFPNPYSLSAGGVLQVEQLPKNAMLSVFDINGRLMKTYTGETQLDLVADLDRPSPGTYIIQMQAEGYVAESYKLLIME